MIKTDNNLDNVKFAVKNLQTKKVTITQNLGRNKFVSFSGVLSGVYPALFSVTPDCEYNGKTAFSYSEVLCGAVKIEEA